MDFENKVSEVLFDGRMQIITPSGLSSHPDYTLLFICGMVEKAS